MTVKSGVPIIEGDFVASTLLPIFTVSPEFARTRVDNIVFSNITGSIVPLTVQIIESGGSAGNDKIVVDNIDVPANESFEPSRLLQGMNTGDSIHAIAGTANAINVRATGTTFSA